MLYRIVFISCCCIVLALAGCDDPVFKPDDKITQGSDIPLKTTDTLTIKATTVREGPLTAKNLPNIILGSMDDPSFGKSLASFYTEVSLPSNSVSFGENLSYDSLVLTLDYSGAYGDVSIPQDYVVYEMTEDIDDDGSYESDATFNTGSEVGRLTGFAPNTEDSVQVDGDNKAPHMRIRLKDSFGKALLQEAEDPGFTDKEDFNSFLNGFYVAVDTSTGHGKGVVYFDLATIQSKLTLYYKDSLGNRKTFDFVINEDDADWVSNYQHNYSGTIAQSFLNSSSDNDSLLMIQSMAGLKGKIEFPYLDSLQNILVNKAELVLTVTESPSGGIDVFPPPSEMTVNRIDSNMQNTFISDQFESSDYFGGTIFSGTNSLGKSVNRYKFNIARYFQRVINGKIDNNGIFLLTFPSNGIGDRVIIGGAKRPANNIKLTLTFTKIQ